MSTIYSFLGIIASIFAGFIGGPVLFFIVFIIALCMEKSRSSRLKREKFQKELLNEIKKNRG
jgi:hypothetical protein